MRKVLVVFLCSLSIAAHSTDYYISSSGNDAASGLSSSTPWQSISKVNSVLSSLNAGDRILFKCGDIFYGSLKISVSGTTGNPVTISAYGSGPDPVISGFTRITGWISYSTGIYTKQLACQSSPNMVLVNNVNTPIGRWPNSGLLTIDSHVLNSSITDSELPASPDWAGAEVVIRKNAFIWDRNKITVHSGNTLNYTSGSYYNAKDGFGYFMQNSIKTLDQTGEWYYDGTTLYMYFGAANPETYDVRVSTLDQLVSVVDKNYITIDNIAFEGANQNALIISNSDYITVQNCSINFSGSDGICGPVNGTSTGCKILNNSISNSNNCAIELSGNHTNAVVTGNTVSGTGTIIGMGKSGDGTYNALYVHGSGSLVQYNIIENSGYMGINFSGDNTAILNNFVNGFNLVKNDGGGIYTYVGTGTPHSGQKVIGNIVLNGAGLGEGEPGKPLVASGIYLDDRVRNVVVTGNTAANCSTSGVYIHNAHEIEISGNTLFNNGHANINNGAQILFVHDGYSPDDPIRNLNISNNIFFARTASQNVLTFSTTGNDIPGFGISDYNCFSKPVDNSIVARTWSGGWSSPATNRSLSNWQSFTGKDRNSYTSRTTITDANKIRFEYNATATNRIITLDGNYIDCKGNKFSGSMTLLPFMSAVIMPDPTIVSVPVANAPPVVVVGSPGSSYSGFISELNASASYDPDKDNLTFTWIAPTGIPVSSTNGPSIKFLSPVLDYSRSVEFTLKISDGKTVQSKVIPVVILPYQPDLTVAEIGNVESSGFQTPHYPHNILDGNIGTMWSVNGDEQWVILDLKKPFNIEHIKLAFMPGQKYEAYFDVLGSEDRLNWELILSKSKSCAFSGNLQVFDFPASKTEREFRFVKLVGRGNSVNTWNNISEFRIFGHVLGNPSYYENQAVKIYPNPANDFINVRIDDPAINIDFLRIVNLAGKIVLEKIISPETREFRTALNLMRGIYIVQMGFGKLTLFTQKIIVSR